MEKRNCITSMLCALVFVYFFIQCDDLAEKAALWPRIICIAGLVFTVLDIVIEGIKWLRLKNEQKPLWALTAEQTKRTATILCLLLVWIMGLTTIGFLVSSVIALCVIAVVFEPFKDKQHIVRDLVVCTVFGIIFYFIFEFLGINFPLTWLI